MYDMVDMMRSALKNHALDDAKGDSPKQLTENEGKLSAAALYARQNIALNTVAALQAWASDDFDDEEHQAENLFALFLGIADVDDNGEIGEDEEVIIDAAVAAAHDYLAKKGVSEDDLQALLNDWDDAAAERVRDYLMGELPEGEDAELSDMDDFVFSDEDNASIFDAVYKKAVVMRNGKKQMIKKRVSGTVHLSAAQKAGISKAHSKSHSAAANAQRARSMKMRSKMGL